MNQIKRPISVLLSVTIILLQSGCSMVVPGKQKLSVIATEPDAKIFVNGNFIGAGNVITRVPRNRDASIMVKKDGYYPTTREIGTTMSMFGILDIIGGFCFLVPFIGLMFPGARELDTPNISVVLEKEKQS